MEKYLAPDVITEGELPERWKRFKTTFTHFLTAVGKKDEAPEAKTAIFLRVVGPRVNDMYETMAFAVGEDKNDYDTTWMSCAREGPANMS